MTPTPPVGPYDLIDNRERVMTPTPAQIEAAHSAYYKARHDDKPLDECWRLALTAAAEVGEHGNITGFTLRELEKQITATIERCAQVAETYPAGMDRVKAVIAKDIAAAIRALKDK